MKLEQWLSLEAGGGADCQAVQENLWKGWGMGYTSEWTC